MTNEAAVFIKYNAVVGMCIGNGEFAYHCTPAACRHPIAVILGAAVAAGT
jgi:hypothetical protein